MLIGRRLCAYVEIETVFIFDASRIVGTCDRRGFSARCPCIGMKEMERCGTTLLSSVYYPLSMRCAMHTLFQMFSLIFCATASALWLVQQASSRWLLVVSSQRAIEPCSASDGHSTHRQAVEHDP